MMKNTILNALFVSTILTSSANAFLSSNSHSIINSPIASSTCRQRDLVVVQAFFNSNNNNKNTNVQQPDESADELRRFDKARRSADVNSRVVELVRPLGMILNEDKQGNVYVEAIAPKGNAARSGMVQEGDIVTMCSATFGDQMWSTRGVGLNRVLAAIKVRAGGTVKLAFESPQETKRKAQLTKAQLQQMEEARRAAQEKKDRLLTELERDEERLKKGKFLGLF